MKKNMRIASQVLSHSCLVLAAVYILFYILDRFNPQLHFLAKIPAIDLILAILTLVAGITCLVAWELMRKHKH